MTVEARYMRSDIDSGSLYKLLTTNTGSAISVTIAGEGPSGTVVYVGVRVYVYHADTSKTEITSGSAVAVVSQGTGVSQFTTLSNTWACPETSLELTDKILIEVYGQLNTNPPTTLLRSFITEALNAVKLDAATWTVVYRLQRIRYGTSPDYLYYWKFWHGSSADKSYIINFTWTPIEPTAKSFSDSGGGSDGFLNPYRAMPFSDAGHGAEAFNTPFRSMGFGDVGAGVDVFALLRMLAFADVGSGTDAFTKEILGAILKAFADTGLGTDVFVKQLLVIGTKIFLTLGNFALNLKTGELIEVFSYPFLISGNLAINLKTGEVMVAI